MFSTFLLQERLVSSFRYIEMFLAFINTSLKNVQNNYSAQTIRYQKHQSFLH